MKNEKKINNKGFSLVELIIVIAIMAVLVGVLAPQFMKYVEQSRKSRDIQTAQNLQTAYLADIADGTLTGAGSNLTISSTSGATTGYSGASGSIDRPTTVSASENLTAVGRITGNAFTVTYDAAAGTVSIFASGYELTLDSNAQAYKTATAAKSPTP